MSVMDTRADPTQPLQRTLPRMDAPASAAPLTAAQQGQWFGQQLEPGNPIYNAAHLTHIRGALDVAAFARAVEQTLAEADALSLAFVVGDDGAPRQYFDRARRPALERLHFGGKDASAQARAWIDADLQVAVNPLVDPLARHVLLQVGDGAAAEHWWYQRVHHLAADGYAMALIEHRAAALYHAFADGQAAPGEPLTSFRAVVEEDADYLASAACQKDAAWWRQQFDGLDSIESLTDASAQTAPTIVHASAALPAETLALLRQRQKSSDCGWPEVLITLIAAYIQRHVGACRAGGVENEKQPHQEQSSPDSPPHSRPMGQEDDGERTAATASQPTIHRPDRLPGQQEVVVGVPSMGRLGSAGARSVAFVMNITPLRLDVDQSAPLDTLIAACARQLVRGRRHGRYRSEQIRRDLALPGGQSRLHGPLINILPFDAAYARSQLDARQEVLRAGPVEDFNFNLRAASDGSDMRVELEANPRVYTQDEVQAQLPRLLAFLHAALRAETLLPVQTLHGAEYEQQVHGVNQTAHAVPDTTLVALVADSCARHPGNEALRMGGRSISYAEFGQLVDRAACRLQAAGVQHGSIVAVALPRSPEMVLSLHAIQRAGAAWLPLDVEQPAERSQRILASADCSALIVDASTRASSGGHAKAFDVHALFAEGAATDPAALPQVRPEDAAYVLFTSGSTGDPKGVIVCHRAIVNRLLWMKRHYDLSAANRFLQKTAYTFDVSVWELFLPMLCAAPLVVAAPGVHRDPHALAAIIRTEQVDVAHFVPSMLAAFLDDEASAGLRMDKVFCSGEALPAHLRDAFHARMCAELHNLYGPAEAAVDVSWWPASRDDDSDPVPIGFPTWNTQLYIVDDHLRPVPPGVTGHLYLAGVQLADGYLSRSDLTDAAFGPDIFSEQAGARMYKSGDLARRRADGAVVYMGRTDHQIKLRGQRVELGEIEAALASHPQCAQVAVVPNTDAQKVLRLVAYVVPAEDDTTPPEALEQQLLAHAGQKLPPYMVPSAVVLLPALPVNTSGKLDAKTLPTPKFTSHATRAAQTPGEKQVAQAFAQVLGMSGPAGADDDFFSLGGHSLLAAQLAAALRQQTGAELTLGAVFEHPTVERLAAWLEHLRTHASAGAAAGFGPLFTLREDQSANPAPALFCIHPAGGLAWCYGSLARQLAGTRAVVGLQSPALAGQQGLYPTLAALAAHFADEIEALQPSGPCHLLGWSVGGIIAQELACELRQRQRSVGVVCLLDAYPSEAWRERAPAEAANPYRAILHIAGYDPDEIKIPLTQGSVIAFLRESGHPLGELGDAQLQGILDSVAYNNALVRAHQHRRYDGPLLYARAALDHEGNALSPAMWQPWAASLQVIDVPSLHAHLPAEPALGHWLPALESEL